MVAAIIGAAGVAVSAAGAMSQASAAKKAGKAAQENGDAQTQLGRDNLDWQKDRYNEWDKTFQPILGDIKDEAYRNMQPDYASVNSDVDSAFGSAQGSQLRGMERMGIKPTDGATTAMNTGYGLGKAEALVGGDQNERHRVANQRLSNLESVYHLGDAQLGVSSAGVNNAVNGLSSAYGQQQGFNQGNANASGAAAGSLLSNGLQWGMNAAGNANWGGNGGMTVNTGNPGGSMGTVSLPDSAWHG